MSNVIYLIMHSPNINVLSKGTIIKEDDRKVYIVLQDKEYIYIKEEKDIGTYYISDKLIHFPNKDGLK